MFPQLALKQQYVQKLWVVLLALLLAHQGIASEQQEREKLQQIANKIRQLQKTIEHTSKEAAKLNSQLQENEERIIALQTDINKVSGSIRQLNTELDSLQQQQQSLHAVKEQQKSAIVAEINASYRLGREQTLKLILNQEDPQKVSRALKYHDYLLKARADKFNAYLKTLTSLEQVATSIKQNKQQLSTDRQLLSKQKDILVAQQRQREAVLTRLNRSLKSDDQSLSQLFVERKRLEAVIKELGEAVFAINLPSTVQPFSKQKGKLSWPTQGKLRQRFGSTRNNRIKWDGWLIAAPEGTPVKAIHHGRVIFADYLRGQGMLIIVDHGDGYMSLYAHNQLVLKETGEWVQQGEAIARVGNTGGQQQSALYFEIRQNGKPTNPKTWLRG